jgi:hypothetical protein
MYNKKADAILDKEGRDRRQATPTGDPARANAMDIV